MHSLIAEDDFTSRSMLAAVLKKAGHESVDEILADADTALYQGQTVGPQSRGLCPVRQRGSGRL